ncbi:MAG TPA: 3-hydroxyacyl-CoA dehydrogenase NAD-binding domain-containing protein [Gemmatimonadales bacterium]
MSDVGSRLQGPVAVVTFDNPPVNGLSHAVRVGLARALERAIADEGVSAVVLTGGGRHFSAGADIREFGTPAATAEPTLRRLIELVEDAPTPVIAAIQGSCLGGGLEIALAAHYRIAARDATLGLPEVKLGLIPGAGGTQRLPRLLAPARALELILGGEPVRAGALAEIGLLDRVVSGDPVEEAIAFAASESLPPRRTRDRSVDGAALAAACEAARARLATERHPLPASLRAVEAVASAALPFDQGLAAERRAFVALMQSPESKALRHAFLAERAAGKVADLAADTPARPVEQAAVIGAGTMGAGIAVALLDAGLPVWLLETDEPALTRGRGRIAGIYEAQVQKGRLTPAERDRRLGQLRPTLEYGALAGADMAIEAVFESLPVKREVFAALDRVMKPGAILATNTSTLDVNAIAELTRRPADVLGLHFFSPANVMRLLEVVRGRATAPEVLATALALARTLRKVAVVSGVCDGFIGNRMLDAYVRQAWWLVEEGAMPWQVDQAIEAFGFAMGPFRVGDLVGHDVSQAIRERRRAERPGYRCSTLADELCRLGRLGQKAGGGWYDYPDGPRRPVPSPAAEALVIRQRAALGVAPRAIEDQEIVERLVYALVNEGARLLEEGIAARPGDIDVVYITGYGFPRWRGGPMYHAEQAGLDRVVARMREFAGGTRGDPEFWQPARLLEGARW